ncbi:NADH dehydrogenase [ubiquinone] 1 subunit C2 [Apis cerana]|nr:NADH dehydrogenase [ubiquinone] 1 subunit C2 [Apis cerana]
MEAKQENFSAQWALDLLEPTALDQSNYIFKYYLAPIAGITCGYSQVILNKIQKKPTYANKPYMLLGFLGGSLFGFLIHGIFEIKSARKDAIMRDYIRLHPEQFPKPEYKKYADILEPWTPCR